LEIPIEKIICDIKGRTNEDTSGLYKSLNEFGQIDPILVEGPDGEGNYYLIHGFLRLMAMSQNKNKFKMVKCICYGEMTTTENRNAVRLLLVSNSKKTTGLDEQLIYEELQDIEERESLFPSYKKRRMKKGSNVPQEDRIKYGKKRRSQDALALLYDLEGLGSYKSMLLESLYDGEITTIHSDAIKRVIKQPMYKQLKENQKITVIEQVKKSAKFTDEKAKFLIFEQLMKQSLDKTNLNNWIEYICDEIDNVTDLVNDEIKLLGNDLHKIKLKKSLDKLNEKLKWLNDNDTQQKTQKNQKEQKSSLFKVDRIENEKEHSVRNDKKVIVMEKRNGNKMTFYFS